MGSTENNSRASYGPKRPAQSRQTRLELETIQRMETARKRQQDNEKVRCELAEIQQGPEEKTGNSNDGKTDGTDTQQSDEGRQGQQEQTGQPQSRNSYVIGTGSSTTWGGGGKDNHTNYGKGGLNNLWSYPPGLGPSTTKR